MNFPLQKYPMFHEQTEPSHQNCPLIHFQAVSEGWGSSKDFVPNDKSTTLWNLPQQITRKSSYLPTSSSTSLFFILQNLPVDAISKSKFQEVLFSGFQLPSSCEVLMLVSQQLHSGGLCWLVVVVPSQGQVTTRSCTSLARRGFRRTNTWRKTTFATNSGNGDNPKHIYKCDVVEKNGKKRNMRLFLPWDLLRWKSPKKAFSWNPLSHLNKLCYTKIHAHTSI